MTTSPNDKLVTLGSDDLDEGRLYVRIKIYESNGLLHELPRNGDRLWVEDDGLRFLAIARRLERTRKEKSVAMENQGEDMVSWILVFLFHYSVAVAWRLPGTA